MHSNFEEMIYMLMGNTDNKEALRELTRLLLLYQSGGMEAVDNDLKNKRGDL